MKTTDRRAVLDAEKIRRLLKVQSVAIAQLERLGAEISLTLGRMEEHAQGFEHQPECCSVCQQLHDEAETVDKAVAP